MLAESLQAMPVPAALEAWDAAAICGGSLDAGEITLWIDPAKIVAVCRYLKDQLDFVRVSGISVIDRYPAEPRFEVFYLLHSLKRNQRLRLKVAVEGANPEVDSVTPVWSGADWYEREAWDLFGVRFRGHPDLKRLMLPDDWEGHPLRKDFPVDGHKYSYQDEA